MSRKHRWAIAALVALVWLGTLRFVVDLVRPRDPAQLAAMLTQDLVQVWRPEASEDATSTLVGAGVARAVAREREVNPEWDFMGRTYLVLALADQALASPGTVAHREALATIDRILADTVRLEASGGPYVFLLPYGRSGLFRDAAAGSLFVDGEIALMLAARQTLAPDSEVERRLRRRIDRIVAQMQRGPVMSGESYPNECWTFCNTTALAAIALADRALAEDHHELLQEWVRVAKLKLVDPENGLLVSSYTWDGEVLDGPEGSSLWMSAHNLLLVDPEFARAQFEAAREQLFRTTAGFGWATEWPEGAARQVDVDSGPVIPGLGASPGSSGLALLGATAFGDAHMRDALLRSMELAAFPTWGKGGEQSRRYVAAGRIGNSVAAYALSFGPLWEAR